MSNIKIWNHILIGPAERADGEVSRKMEYLWRSQIWDFLLPELRYFDNIIDEVLGLVDIAEEE